MKLQTQIPLAKAHHQIDYNSQLLLLGSCFVEHIGDKLHYFKFQSVQNPFGILFHPVAIENLISRAVKQQKYTEEDIFFLNERWHCFEAHSDLSSSSKEQLLLHLNQGLEKTLGQLKKATHIVITLGTAWVYETKLSNTIVANCHKVPQKEFSKKLLSVEDIEKSLTNTIAIIKTINDNIQFIFTISPVRHLKDGFTENQLSKAHLMTALHKILNSPLLLNAVAERSLSEVPPLGGRGLLFPSYEIMMDELRDYRFYAEDMVHPNSLAIQYIWEKFTYVWISEAAQATMVEIDSIQKGWQHKSFHPDSEAHQQFLKKLETKMQSLQKKLPFLEF
ncbi:GSCFA domain-containing protein [Cellulophaga sp. Hel_I_12]|uniref:GSCFA domain-containing protein n=1 Tax=Cellulophaga sp. Hel_I_12 TaxID=1249972 RepID=UPI000645C52C|nr:GSCFA domain-containing protein [Cellulophaga sp. Hel_I_12]